MLSVTSRIAEVAGLVAEQLRLRALDAIHLASALEFAELDPAVVSWDADLRRAALEAGLAVVPANT